MATLGERIRKRRTELGLSQAELGRRVGVKREAVSQWENGASKGLKPQNLLKTADMLDTTVRWLVTGHRSASDALEGREDPLPYTPEALHLAAAIQSLPARDRAHLQAVADAFVKSAPWDGEVERRKEGKA